MAYIDFRHSESILKCFELKENGLLHIKQGKGMEWDICLLCAKLWIWFQVPQWLIEQWKYLHKTPFFL